MHPACCDRSRSWKACRLVRRVALLALVVLLAAPVAGWSGDDLLDGEPAAGVAPEAHAEAAENTAAKMHDQLFVEGKYPSATVCRSCHPEQYREWAMSQHAYAQISPTAQAMQGLVQKVFNITTGDFCIRCHNPVGMGLGEGFYMSSADRHPASYEGITCVACHRVSAAYGKVNGRVRIDEGQIFAPIKGPTGNQELKKVLEKADEFHVTTEQGKPGRGIHGDAIYFEQISASSFCGTCHDVTLPNGAHIEEAYSEYKMSAAAKRGISCQDCHMSTEPGIPSGYRVGPAAVVGGVPTRPRRRADHRLAGPDYSLVHPGLFPHNDKARALATQREWLTFDWKAGWGTREFEAGVPKDFAFPPRWRSLDDRMDARAIVEENLATLKEIAEERRRILRVGVILDDVVVDRADAGGIRFRVKVRNGIDAHNVPTGFDAERAVFVHVTVRDADGRKVFESGDQDPNGDIRDQHSLYVRNGELPIDDQVFALHSKFVVRMLRGGEREQVAPVNISLDALPFLRPDVRPTILFGHPDPIRKHRQTLSPLAERWASYSVSAGELNGSRPPYSAHAELIFGMLTPALLNDIQVVGFDYNMSPREMGQALLAGYQVLWDKTISIDMRN